ncbi:hypothetical protein POM88_025264 [Heracleum sosnowskyi]|uniref:Uncharacterized protein n=1 Tax=Heracleum sosnowskyi TaxID=360622 RepID=A0AAD8I6P5_9APIA|nr:hypothetical protein POM88_025264 [Heracleum sosnowskyi]
MQQESEEYIPPEHEEQSENETVKTPKKVTKKVEKTKLNIGPTTRSRANILVEKDASEKDVRNSVPAEPAPECAIQLPRNEGIGTMASYLLLRDNQKKNARNGSASGSGTAKGKAVAENDLPDIENEVVDEPAAPKRRRGRTRMDKVHTRSVDKRVVIHMNKEFQPILDNDKVVSELNNFLGTLRSCFLYHPVPSVEAVFLKTRKRNPRRKYKTDTAVMNYRLEKIEKAMAAPGGSSGIDELISDGDLCATSSTDNENGTPMIGGPSS